LGIKGLSGIRRSFGGTMMILSYTHALLSGTQF